MANSGEMLSMYSNDARVSNSADGPKKYMAFKHLKSEQKEAICLLYVGTFLEYFDLYLFIYMAVVLDDLFYPTTDPNASIIFSTLFFCSIFIFRPLGVLLLGYLGDNIGRKPTVIITTGITALSCIVMASVPTYAQIGITATYIIIACRVLQGMASMVEVIGADLYITELIEPPLQYPMVMLVPVSGVAGAIASLVVAKFVTSFNFDWRSAFLLGAIIAVVGIIARTRLRETPDFVDAKLRIKRAVKTICSDLSALNNNAIWSEKVNKKTALALFAIDCGWPACFYFAFIYCSGILKQHFQLTAGQIIHHNLVVSIIQFLCWISIAYLSYRLPPLKILKARLIIFIPFILLCPYFFAHATMPFHIMLIQLAILIFGCMGMPAKSIFYKHLPIFKRFTYATFAYALSRTVVYPIILFVISFFSSRVEDWVMSIVMGPIAVSFMCAVIYFDKVEKAKQAYISDLKFIDYGKINENSSAIYNGGEL